MSGLEKLPSRLVALFLLFALSICFCLATSLEAWFSKWNSRRSGSASVLTVLMGDSRRIFANHFLAKADAYFHAGFYPTIFDQRAKSGASQMLAKNRPGADENHDDHAHDHAGETGDQDARRRAEGMDFLDGKPLDWIERFGRNFFPVIHAHLEEGKEREILPWLKLSAELDPHQVDTYVTAGYWLNRRLGKPAEAEQFLRQGLRANPDSYEILSELGVIYADHKKEPDVARTLWELAIEKWHKQEREGWKPHEFALEQILVQLVRLEQQTGDNHRLLRYLQLLKEAAIEKQLIEEQIQEVKAKLSASAGQSSTKQH